MVESAQRRSSSPQNEAWRCPQDPGHSTTYITAHVESLREEAAGVFLYVAHVMLEAALTCIPKPTKVSASDIVNAEKDLRSGIEVDSEPYLLEYAADAFTEGDDVTLGSNEIESMMESAHVVALSIHRAF